MAFPSHANTSRDSKYRRTMASDSFEKATEELVELIEGRPVSPTIKLQRQEMLATAEELRVHPKGGDAYVYRNVRLVNQETILHRMLEKDAALYEERFRMQRLVGESFRLRYGDYFAGNLSEVKKHSMLLAKDQRVQDPVGRKSWAELLEGLRKEEKDKMLWAEKRVKGELGTQLYVPLLNWFRRLSEEVRISYPFLRFQIHQYAERCAIAHSGIEIAIKKKLWKEVAEFINNDRHILLTNDHLALQADEKVSMIAAISQFEDRIFRKIEVRYSKALGRYEVLDGWILSDRQLEIEEKEKRDTSSRAEAKIKVEKSTDIIKRAATVSDDASLALIRRRDALISASEEYEKNKKDWTSIQKRLVQSDENRQYEEGPFEKEEKENEET